MKPCKQTEWYEIASWRSPLVYPAAPLVLVQSTAMCDLSAWAHPVLPCGLTEKAFISKLYFLGAQLQTPVEGKQGLLGNLHGVDTPLGSALIIPFRHDPGTRVMDENTLAFWSNNKIRHEVWWHGRLSFSLSLFLSLSLCEAGTDRSQEPITSCFPMRSEQDRWRLVIYTCTWRWATQLSVCPQQHHPTLGFLPPFIRRK